MAPPKSDNHDDRDYWDVKDFDKISLRDTGVFTPVTLQECIRVVDLEVFMFDSCSGPKGSPWLGILWPEAIHSHPEMPRRPRECTMRCLLVALLPEGSSKRHRPEKNTFNKFLLHVYDPKVVGLESMQNPFIFGLTWFGKPGKSPICSQLRNPIKPRRRTFQGHIDGTFEAGCNGSPWFTMVHLCPSCSIHRFCCNETLGKP